MIHTRRTLTADQELEFDVCIIGSGAGGGAAAYSLSRAGRRVAVIERGSYLTPKDFSQREEKMFPQLFYDAGGRRTRDKAIRVLHGHGVGGSTLHNINLCKRTPEEVIAGWELPRFNLEKFNPYLIKIESLLGVTAVREDQLNASNRAFRRGVEKLGYRGGMLSHNRQGCVGSGFCELGCAFDAKMNVLRVLVPQAVAAGAEIYADTRAVAVEHSGRRARGVQCEVLAEDGRVQARLRIRARTVICAGGAIETPLLLQRSGVPDPNHLVGSRLHLHPGVVAAGVFDEPINSWMGIPQSYECTEFLSFKRGGTDEDKRVWIIAGSAHPAGAASLLPSFGDEHRKRMEQYPRFAPLSSMVHDRSSGTVGRKGEYGADINYQLNEEDCAQLARGLRESARILLAAGAREVLFPFTEPLVVRNDAELQAAPIAVRPLEIDVVAVHPMSSVWMGRDAHSSCTDESGRYQQLDNLYISDASLYPTSLGVPPQISTYAIGLYVADQIT